MYEKRYSNMADSERVKLESDVEDSYDIYPHPTVRVVRPNVRVIGHSSWKEALTEVTRRKAFLGFLAILVFILLLTIVIVLMVQGRNEEIPAQKPIESAQKYGLISYPVLSEGEVIRFKPDDPNTYRKWIEKLDDALTPYSFHLQGKENHSVCQGTVRPKGKQCVFHIDDLSYNNECQRSRDYGFKSEKPCVLLQLTLPYHPGTVVKDSATWNKFYEVLGTKWNPSFISVTCDGKTDQDKADLELARMPENKTAVTYRPSDGFSLAYFPSDLRDEIYLAPLVMVQIRVMNLHRPVTVECIAWAQDKDGKLPQTSELYRTEFKIMME